MDEFKPSYVLIALRAEAPIIPVITDGQYGFFKRVHLIIGKPIDLWDYCTSEDPTKEEIMALNDIVYKKCLELQRELEGGMAVSIGRLREDTVYDYKFVGLSHNTLRGAAGGAVLIAELLYREGYFN